MTPKLRLKGQAAPGSPAALRHALMAFLEALQIERTWREDIVLAVGEALANAAEHAYGGTVAGAFEMYARKIDDAIVVDVADEGKFIEREIRPHRGFGLRIVRAIARDVQIDTAAGTRISMTFASQPPAG